MSRLVALLALLACACSDELDGGGSTSDLERLMGDVRNTIAACLDAFYDEGPGGGHYENMMGNYGSVGCGVYLEGDAITIVQDFGR